MFAYQIYHVGACAKECEKSDYETILILLIVEK